MNEYPRIKPTDHVITDINHGVSQFQISKALEKKTHFFYLRRGRLCAVMQLDFERFYDSMTTKVISRKMCPLGIRGRMAAFVQNWMSGRIVCMSEKVGARFYSILFLVNLSVTLLRFSLFLSIGPCLWPSFGGPTMHLSSGFFPSAYQSSLVPSKHVSVLQGVSYIPPSVLSPHPSLCSCSCSAYDSHVPPIALAFVLPQS